MKNNKIEDNFIIHNEDCYTDEIGGHHDSGIGWAPNGHWCGECTILSCSKCLVWTEKNYKNSVNFIEKE